MPAVRAICFPIQSGAFGRHDISGIRAHTGPAAVDAAQAMGARAYASGDDVVRGDGADLHTQAHEAAHVIQQRGGVALEDGVGRPGDGYATKTRWCPRAAAD